MDHWLTYPLRYSIKTQVSSCSNFHFAKSIDLLLDLGEFAFWVWFIWWVLMLTVMNLVVFLVQG